MSRSSGKCGVIYIAAGKEYTEQAIASARSIGQWSPGLAIHLFTDQKSIEGDLFEGVTHIEKPHARSKIDYLYQSPFDHTLYLDADTRSLTDIREMFQLLDQFDLAIAHAHKRNHFPTNQVWRVKIPNSFPQMNGGVILFRKNKKTLELLRDWQNAYHNESFTKDQVTLRELLWLSDLRIHILPPEYNIRYEKYLEVWSEKEAKPKILHLSKFKGEVLDVRDKKLSLIQKWKWRWNKLKWLWRQVKSLV